MLSRKENGALVQKLMNEATHRYLIAPHELTIYQDRGASMIAHSYTDLMGELGVTLGHSRHPHSRIKFVTSEQRHNGLDAQILSDRHALYQRKKTQNPERWSGEARDWDCIGAVNLNPEKGKEAA